MSGYWDSRYAVHYINSEGWNNTTACGLGWSYYLQGVYGHWRGVTCKRCKATKKRTATKVRDAKRAVATVGAKRKK